MHTASFYRLIGSVLRACVRPRALEGAAWAILVVLLAGWDEGATSVFLAILLPMHLVATHLMLDCWPEMLRPRLWTLARLMLLLPVFVAGN
jgi:hypothetical protein